MEYQAAAPEGNPPYRILPRVFATVEKDVRNARANQPNQQGPEGEVRDHIGIDIRPQALPPHQVHAKQKSDRHHQAVGMDFEWAQFNQRRQHGRFLEGSPGDVST